MNVNNLLGYSRTRLRQFCLEMGEKPFRADQLMQWIHQRRAGDFASMTNLAKSLREKLQNTAEIRAPEVKHHHVSTDGTQKWVFAVEGGNLIETVFIPDGDRGTLCISSQAGCALDCKFCSTGKQGFSRDLTAAEIIGQVWVASRTLIASGYSPKPRLSNNEIERPITNIVFMGMGEPLLNFDAVIEACEILLDDFAYGISKRRLTISTSGVVPAMERLLETIDVALAVSLHAPNDKLRDELVPINKKYPLEMLLNVCKKYVEKVGTRRRVTMEYVMLKDVNDSLEHAKQLAELLRDVPSKINLIPFNPFPYAPYKTPSMNQIHRFQDYLNNAGFTTTIRTTRGEDIDAACGQLAGQIQDRTKRSEQWQAIIWRQQNESLPASK